MKTQLKVVPLNKPGAAKPKPIANVRKTSPDENGGVRVDLPILLDVKLLLDSEDNPNVQTEATMDLLVQGIREDGFDEPVIVIPHTEKPGYYKIVSGHHRVKAAKIAGAKKLPVYIKKDWDEDKRKIEIVRRNQLRGSMDPAKFTKLFNDAAKSKDRELLKREMGFTQKKQFEALYEQVSKNLTTEQKKKLSDAKETIKSVDDLSSVLNTIFKESGSTVEQGYLVFSFGGKNHHYFQIDEETDKMLVALEKSTGKGDNVMDILKAALKVHYNPAAKKPVVKSAPKKVS